MSTTGASGQHRARSRRTVDKVVADAAMPTWPRRGPGVRRGRRSATEACPADLAVQAHPGEPPPAIAPRSATTAASRILTMPAVVTLPSTGIRGNALSRPRTSYSMPAAAPTPPTTSATSTVHSHTATRCSTPLKRAIQPRDVPTAVVSDEDDDEQRHSAAHPDRRDCRPGRRPAAGRCFVSWLRPDAGVISRSPRGRRRGPASTQPAAPTCTPGDCRRPSTSPRRPRDRPTAARRAVR